jgi:bacterioferritin-associated ferredoxin
MAFKGHIILQDGRSLCGETHEVKQTSLYGEQCGECYEYAKFLFRGGKINHISKKDIDKETK